MLNLKKWIAEKAIELIIAACMAAIVVLAINHYQSLKQQAAVGAQRGVVLETASGVIADGTAADAQYGKASSAVDVAATQFDTQREEAKRNEPETASRANRAVPVSMRNAYRERRRTRERLGCIPSQCDEAFDADTTAER